MQLFVSCKKTPEVKADDGTIWTCSMHPQVREKKPGLCPICHMELIPLRKSPVESSETQTSPSHPIASLSSEQTSNLSVRTTPAVRGTIEQKIQLFGEIAPIEDRHVDFSWDYDGRIEKVLIDFNQSEIQKGDPLYEVYSEQVLADQEAYLDTLRERWLRTFYERDILTAKLDAIAAKLRRAGFTESDLKQLETTHKVQKTFTLRSPATGSIMGNLLTPGMRFEAKSSLAHIAPLREVWFVAKAYEKDFAAMRLGQSAMVECKAHAGISYPAKLVYMGRTMDPHTRTLDVRFLVSNPDLELIPNLSGVATLDVKSDLTGVIVPTGAILDTGKRTILYVEKNPGHYELRDVVLGIRSDSQVMVQSGVEVGESVVIQGSFLIDAEAQLKGESTGSHQH